ncbi:head decoration protein [Desulfarculus baarsii]
MPAEFTSAGAHVPEILLAGGGDYRDRRITVASGQGVLPRGAVLGRITASGKYALSLAAAEDGSQTPDAVLVEDVDATDADAAALIYYTGDFLESGLTMGEGHDVESIREGLRSKGIFIHTVG